MFSTRPQAGRAATGGGWASYLIDKSGLWMFGDFWPLVARGTLALAALVGLAWSLRTLRQVLCCCCLRRAGGSNEGVGAPPGANAPRVAVDLPSLEVVKGFVALELTGPDAPPAPWTQSTTSGRFAVAEWGVNLTMWWSSLHREPLGCSPPGKVVIESTAPAY